SSSVQGVCSHDNRGRLLRIFSLTLGSTPRITSSTHDARKSRESEMLNIPVLRWGQPYTSMDTDHVVHFATGEPIAKVSRANGGLIQRDMRKAERARSLLREIPMDDMIERVKKAGELYMDAELPLGDGTQTPDAFIRAQSASTGLPEHMCRANMK